MNGLEEHLGFILDLGTAPSITRTAVNILSNSFLRRFRIWHCDVPRKKQRRPLKRSENVGR